MPQNAFCLVSFPNNKTDFILLHKHPKFPIIDYFRVSLESHLIGLRDFHFPMHKRNNNISVRLALNVDLV